MAGEFVNRWRSTGPGTKESGFETLLGQLSNPPETGFRELRWLETPFKGRALGSDYCSFPRILGRLAGLPKSNPSEILTTSIAGPGFNLLL